MAIEIIDKVKRCKRSLCVNSLSQAGLSRSEREVHIGDGAQLGLICNISGGRSVPLRAPLELDRAYRCRQGMNDA